MTIKIVPTVFVSDLDTLHERLELYEVVVKRVQLDVADREFTQKPTLTVAEMVGQPTTLRQDVHLMVNEPVGELEVCAKRGVEVVTAQIELMSDQREFVNEARNLKLKPGLAVDFETKLDKLDWASAKTCDQILIMTVRAGKEFQKFEEEGLKKVREIRKRGYEGEICVDGGVDEKTVAKCVKAGANLLAVGSSLWKAADVRVKYEKLTQLARVAATG